ncbi:MAG: ABC transporter ATP-binding protein, partial [Chloroflexi bacterium]|nr:ABC transporter ATP-binding protein [Chloroflexota bacterium]
VRDNLTYGLEREVNGQEIQNALVAAGADFILHDGMFPEGVDTVLSKNDWRLTDMRKKLLEIARAHIAGPSILLLDRPAGGLNHFEASQVLARLSGLKQGRTSFSVTGRTDEAQFADVILVLKDGRIAEHGTLDEITANAQSALGKAFVRALEGEV